MARTRKGNSPELKTKLDKRREPKTKLKAGDRLTEVPPAPKTLGKDAQKEWMALSPVLVELGTICKGDLRAFEQLCETLATASVLQAMVEAKGVLIETSTGSFKTNPAMRSLETARNQAARLYTEFGLTPKARNYVARAPDPQGPNSFARFLPPA